MKTSDFFDIIPVVLLLMYKFLVKVCLNGLWQLEGDCSHASPPCYGKKEDDHVADNDIVPPT